MSISPIEYLRHIHDETEYLLKVTNGLTRSKFLGDETLKRAVVRSLEIIGEATKKIPQSFISKYYQIEWQSMARMRDILMHMTTSELIMISYGMF